MANNPSKVGAMLPWVINSWKLTWNKGSGCVKEPGAAEVVEEGEGERDRSPYGRNG